MSRRGHIQVERLVEVPAWGLKEQEHARQYWRDHGFSFSAGMGEQIRGRRGSVWGNLVSFDMSRLIATLTITPRSARSVLCTLDVTTWLQDITAWNRAYWLLEIETFESVMMRGDQQRERWAAFSKGRKRAAWEWLFSLGRRGREIPDDETWR